MAARSADRLEAGRGGRPAQRPLGVAPRRATMAGLAKCCPTSPRDHPAPRLRFARRVEAYRFSADAVFLAAARRTADGMLSPRRATGWLPGRLAAAGTTVRSACLTGTAQVAHCWFLMYWFTARGAIRTRPRCQSLRGTGSPTVDRCPGGGRGRFPSTATTAPRVPELGQQVSRRQLLAEMDLANHDGRDAADTGAPGPHRADALGGRAEPSLKPSRQAENLERAIGWYFAGRPVPHRSGEDDG